MTTNGVRSAGEARLEALAGQAGRQGEAMGKVVVW